MHKKPEKKDLILFELIWVLIFSAIALYPLVKLDSIPSFVQVFEHLRHWALYTAAFFLMTAIIYPRLLGWFYRVWVAFGELVGAIISRIILFLLFYLLFTPVALVLRVLGKDLLHKKLDKKAPSYWIDRETQPGTLKNQF